MFKKPLKALKGTYTALITPFTATREVDYAGLEQLVKLQVETGISGLVILGTTAETPTLDEQEKERIVKCVVETVKELNGTEGYTRVPVIVGSGSNATAKAIRETERAKELGADAALVVAPYYNKPSQKGMYLHFTELNQVGLPLIVYNIPGRTGVNIEPSTLERIAELDAVIGVKEASGNLSQIGKVIYRVKMKKPEWSVLSGDDALTLPVMALGGDGVISVVSNLIPKKVNEMVAYALEQDFPAARALHYELLPLFEAAFIETNPQPIKYMMKLAGLPAGLLRLPMRELEGENKSRVEKVMRERGLL